MSRHDDARIIASLPAMALALALSGLALTGCDGSASSPASPQGSPAAPPSTAPESTSEMAPESTSSMIQPGAAAPVDRAPSNAAPSDGEPANTVLANTENHLDAPAAETVATPVPGPGPDPVPGPGPEPKPATEPVDPPPMPAETVTAQTSPVDDLLDRLEVSASELESFAAMIRYDIYNDLLDRTETRRGEIIYRLGGAGDDTKRFAVLFDSLQVNRTLLPRTKHYVFDGQWLAEVDHEEKEFLKQQVVPPGRKLDPLKLGEGPFPMPIGQPRDEVKARFDVQPMAIPTDGPLGKVREAFPALEGIVLVPLPGTLESEDFARVELLYDQDTLLPVGINAVLTNGNRKTVRLTEPRRNPPFDEETAAKLNINEPTGEGWNVTIQPWNS